MKSILIYIVTVLAIISARNCLEKDPCSDFSEYACRGKTKNLLSTMTKSLYIQVKDILLQESDKTTDKARKFFKSCVNKNKIKRNGPRHFFKTAKVISRMFSSLPKKYSQELFQNHFVASKTMFPYDSWISISKVINPTNNSQLLYRISAPKLYLITNLELNADNGKKMESIIRETGRLMKLSRMIEEPLSIELIREMFQLELKILHNSPIQNEELEETLSAEEMDKICPMIGSKTIVDIIRKTKNQTNEAVFPVFIESKESFRRTCAYLALCTHNSKCSYILSNYFKWSAISTLERFLKILPFSSKTDLMEYKNIKYNRYEKSRTFAFTCMVETNHFFPHSLSYLMKKHFSKDIDDKRKKINSVLDAIQKFMIKEISNSKWLKRHDKIKLIMKMEKLKAILFYPKIVNDKLKILREYEHIDINEHNYFTNLMDAIRFKRTKLFQMSSAEEYMLQYIKAMQVNAMYSSNSNMIVIPLGIVRHPIYPDIDDSNDRKGFLFTKVKFLLGHELGHAYDNQGIQFDSNGNYRKLLSNESTVIYSRKADCFIDQYRKYNLSGVLQLSENIADFLGIKSIVHGFHNQSTAYFLQSFESFSEFFCDKFSDEDNNSKDPHSPPKYRINGPLSTSRKFSEIFECPRNSEMNAELKCSLF